MERTIRPAPVNKTIRVPAAPARAFAVFTAGIGGWWPKTHHIGKAELDHPVIEPRAGGRWYEVGVDGSECDIATVLVWDPPHRLVIAWHLDHEFKYDAALATEVEVRFIAEGEAATRVELEHRHLERLGERAETLRQRIDAPDGWAGLLGLFAGHASNSEGR